jgi:SAM-dependent methyltransferase
MTPRPPAPIPEDWYARSFDAWYPIVYAHRTLEAARREAAFAVKELALQPSERVLDLCCGNGRHVKHLLECTPFVVGLDFSPALLSLARDMTAGNAPLVRGDMRAIPFGGVFDVVTSFFTSFGYFMTPEENLQVVTEVARVLKPGGRVFLDYMNAQCVESTLVPESIREYNDYVIRETRWIDRTRRRVNKATRVTRQGIEAGEWGESVQLYSEAEFRALLARGGLTVDRVFGDYDGAPLDVRRPRMMVVAHRG